MDDVLSVSCGSILSDDAFWLVAPGEGEDGHMTTMPIGSPAASRSGYTTPTTTPTAQQRLLVEGCRTHPSIRVYEVEDVEPPHILPEQDETMLFVPEQLLNADALDEIDNEEFEPLRRPEPLELPPRNSRLQALKTMEGAHAFRASLPALVVPTRADRTLKSRNVKGKVKADRKVKTVKEEKKDTTLDSECSGGSGYVPKLFTSAALRHESPKRASPPPPIDTSLTFSLQETSKNFSLEWGSLKGLPRASVSTPPASRRSVPDTRRAGSIESCGIIAEGTITSSAERSNYYSSDEESDVVESVVSVPSGYNPVLFTRKREGEYKEKKEKEKPRKPPKKATRLGSVASDDTVSVRETPSPARLESKGSLPGMGMGGRRGSGGSPRQGFPSAPRHLLSQGRRQQSATPPQQQVQGGVRRPSSQPTRHARKDKKERKRDKEKAEPLTPYREAAVEVVEVEAEVEVAQEDVVEDATFFRVEETFPPVTPPRAALLLDVGSVHPESDVSAPPTPCILVRESPPVETESYIPTGITYYKVEEGEVSVRHAPLSGRLPVESSVSISRCTEQELYVPATEVLGSLPSTPLAVMPVSPEDTPLPPQEEDEEPMECVPLSGLLLNEDVVCEDLSASSDDKKTPVSNGITPSMSSEGESLGPVVVDGHRGVREVEVDDSTTEGSEAGLLEDDRTAQSDACDVPVEDNKPMPVEDSKPMPVSEPTPASPPPTPKVVAADEEVAKVVVNGADSAVRKEEEEEKVETKKDEPAFLGADIDDTPRSTASTASLNTTVCGTSYQVRCAVRKLKTKIVEYL